MSYIIDYGNQHHNVQKWKFDIWKQVFICIIKITVNPKHIKYILEFKIFQTEFRSAM